jgi:hypothetical protein
MSQPSALSRARHNHAFKPSFRLRTCLSVLAGGVVLLLAAAGALVMPAAASTTTGTWYFSPAQTFTTTTTTTAGPPMYQSAVRPPVNSDGSSNWPAKRGVIPVQFDLLAAPTTTTTTTKTYDPPVWKSVQGERVYTFAQLCLQKNLLGAGTCPDAPSSPALAFNDIQNLRADYLFTVGDCFGGSLRWDVYVQHGANIETVEVYYGNPNGVPDPPGQSCSGASTETGKNLMSQVDPTLPVNRFEMQGGWGVPGPVYTTYADAVASTNAGTDKVVAVQLTLDSGWKGDQRADVSNVTVNDNTWVPKTTETTTTTTVSGDYAKTCTLPAAELRWAKNDATPTGAINEAESIQPKDTGQYYRQVDCKYIYNLDVSSLNGQGTYTVWVRIGGQNIQVPATFDLR